MPASGKVEPRRIYVLVEPSDGAPTIRSCDSYLTTLRGLEGLLEQWVEDQLEDGEDRRKLSLTVFAWTEQEFQSYCEQHDINWGDD